MFNDSKFLSYCPADGRFLGGDNGTKPANASDVEQVVDRAVVSQATWQMTSFLERRRVLRTLLKYEPPRLFLCHSAESASYSMLTRVFV